MGVKIEKIKPGIVKLTNNDSEYIFWNHADIVRPYVEKFLKQKFPTSLVLHESNNIDLVVVGENLSVEIQATTVSKWGLQHSSFEKNIEKQIKENIENLGRCFFFFDSEYLRYLQHPNIHKKTSLNMDWFRKYMKEEKLIVFTVRFDGPIAEVHYKEFDFLSNISMTCKIGYDSDDKTLNRNKLLILDRVLKGYKFNQGEIDQFRDSWIRSNAKVEFKKFLYKQEDNRARLFARILHAVSGYLEAVNNILDLNIEDVDMQHEKYYISVLGLFDMENRGNMSMATFVDKFYIREYFPGYIRNRDTWDHILGRRIQGRKLDMILKREYTITKGVDYLWNKAANI